MSKKILAVDGGGTKTHVIYAEAEGTDVSSVKVIEELNSGPINFSSVDHDKIRQNLADVASFFQNKAIDVLVIGAAGVDTKEDHVAAEKLYREIFQPAANVDFVLVNDVVIALESGDPQANAIALISGTGSNCFGRNAAGEQTSTSGMDFLLADEGCGYEIGRQLLRAAMSSYDGRGEKSILEDLLKEQFHVTEFLDLKYPIYHPVLSKSQIAALAPLCFRAVQQGDHVAQKIVDSVVNDLFLMVSTVAKKLDISDQPFDVICVGGVTQQKEVSEPLQNLLRKNFSQVNIKYPEKEPVYGALRLALLRH